MAPRNRVSYSRFAEQDSFIGRYMRAQSGLETAYAYDFWAACWLVGNALRRAGVIARPRIPVFPSWFIVFVAASGATRKSTAVRQAEKVLHLAEIPNLHLITNKVGPNQLINILHHQSLERNECNAALCISEMASTFTRERYMRDLPVVLTDLYDCPALYTGGGFISTGARGLENVYISLLTASTPEWLLRTINPDVISGGFTSRVIFVVAEKRKKAVAWPKDEDRRTPALLLARELKEIYSRAHRRQGIELTDAAIRKHTAWYNRRGSSSDEFRASFEAREDDHVLRLAGTFAASDGSWFITDRHLVDAQRIISECKERGAAIFEGSHTTDQLIFGVDRLRSRLLEADAPALVGELYKDVRRNLTQVQFRYALDIMHEMGMIEKLEYRPPGRGRPSIMYRKTPALRDRVLISKLNQKVARDA